MEFIWAHQCILVIKEKISQFYHIGPTQGLDDTTLTPEAKYSINFSKSKKKVCLSLYYNGRNSFLFVNFTKIYQFKAKYSAIKNHPVCLGNISGDFSANTWKKKTGLNGWVYSFSVDYRTFDISNIINIHKYLMKKHDMK